MHKYRRCLFKKYALKVKTPVTSAAVLPALVTGVFKTCRKCHFPSNAMV
jgi:hypothetical protein